MINIRRGDLALLITEDWTQDSHEAFLRLIRAHWRGWNLDVSDKIERPFILIGRS